MVVFTCNHCGDSLQKPRVEKHYAIQCRRPKSLTCVDCFKDFKNEEYVVHTKCITEEERYGAKGSIPGGIVKKGDAKQESWTDMIRSIVESEKNLNHSLKNLFSTISTYTNVPRKKVKFVNFLKSSSGGRINFSDIEAAWDLIEKYKNEDKPNRNLINQDIGAEPKQKLDDEAAPPKKLKLELKHQGNGVTENMTAAHEEKTTKDSDKFSFKSTIISILSKKGSISCKKLQKKVLSAYLKETGQTDYTERTVKKYNKKLKKIPNVTITEEIVTLVES